MKKLILALVALFPVAAFAADASWTKQGFPGVDFYTTTIGVSSSNTEVLAINPNAAAITVFMDLGVSETVNLDVSNLHPDDVSGSTLIPTASVDADDGDYSTRIEGPLTAIQISGAGVNASTVTIAVDLR